MSATGPSSDTFRVRPVATNRVRSLRFLRYEVRRWRDVVIADIDEAVDNPQLLTDEVAVATHLLELVPEVPTPVGGRDEVSAGEMWNSTRAITNRRAACST